MIGRRAKPSTDEIDTPKGFDDFELRLGDMMRGERATLAKSLLDVQRELRIKASYVAAIENCDIGAFETPGFIAGYVRSYARYLGMDPEWAFQKFCAEANFVVAHGMSAAASGPVTTPKWRRDVDESLANPNASFVPRAESVFANIEARAIGSIAVLFCLVGAIGYGGWAVLQEVQRVQLAPVDQAPGVIAELDPLAVAGGSGAASATAGDDLAALGATVPDFRPDAAALDRLYRPQALQQPVLVPRDGPIAAIDPKVEGVLADPAAAMVSAQPVAEPAPVQVVAADAPAVEVIAVRPSWVRVATADGTVLLEKVLDAGEHYVVPATEAPPILRAGESGAVYFAVNGVTYGPAGAPGSVTKNIVLAPEPLTERYAEADAAADVDLARAVAVASIDASLDAVVNGTAGDAVLEGAQPAAE
ncbi:MAG: RodZ domain-containing protein [Paracoccaceae bacterium]